MLRSLNGLRVTAKSVVSRMMLNVRSIRANPGLGAPAGKSERSTVSSEPFGINRVTAGRSPMRMSGSLSVASSLAYGADKASHRAKPQRKPAAPLASADHRFFGKLPTPENEHRNGRKNDERLPDCDVENLEDRAVMGAQPEQ